MLQLRNMSMSAEHDSRRIHHHSEENAFEYPLSGILDQRVAKALCPSKVEGLWDIVQRISPLILVALQGISLDIRKCLQLKNLPNVAFPGSSDP